MRKAKLLLILILFIALMVTYTGCKVIKNVHYIYNKDVKTEEISLDNKSVKLSPLVHFGQKEFYNNLKDSIFYWKKSGYIIFYEEIRANATDTILLLKWRKINNGNIIDKNEYAHVGRVLNKIGQPEYDSLGIDGLDINADVSLNDVINKYEEFYGPIVLDSCDFQTPLKTSYTNCGKRYKNSLVPILNNYRNNEVIKRIIESDSTRIVVLYGADHIKGIKKGLKNAAKNL